MNARRDLLRGGAALLALAPLSACGLFDEDIKPLAPGHRIDVLPRTYGLEVDPTLSDVALALPPADENADWPQPGRVPTHVLGNVAWSGGDHRVWEVKIGVGQALRSQLTAPPLVADGRVYTMDSAAVLDCFDLQTGRRIWHLETRPKRVRSSNVGGGITWADGTLYCATGLADAFAIDAATGHVRWKISTVTPVHSTPTVADGHLYFVTIDGKLMALEAATGKTLWNYQASLSFNALLGVPAPAYAGGVVLGGFNSGEVAALGALDGSLIWTDTLGGSVAASPLEFASIAAEPIIDGDTAYAISVGGLMTATDMRTGRRIWERNIAGGQTPVLAGDWLFLVTSAATVVCMQKATGHVRWNSVLPRFHRPRSKKQPIQWAGPLLAGGRLVLVSSYGMLVIVEPMLGGIVDVRDLGDAATMAPIAAGGLMLVLTDDGRLTAYA